MSHGNPGERASYNHDKCYATKDPLVVDMSRTLDSHPNVLVMDALPLLLVLETFYLKNQTSLLAKVVATTTTDSVEESAAALLQTHYFTVLHELESFAELYFNQLLNLVKIAKYLGSKPLRGSPRCQKPLVLQCGVYPLFQ